MNNRDCVSAERVVKNTTAKIVRHLIPAMFAIGSFVQAVKRSPIAALLSVTEKFAVVASQKIDAESAIEPGVSAVLITDIVSPQIFIFVLAVIKMSVRVVLDTTKNIGPIVVMRVIYVSVVLDTTKSLGPNIVDEIDVCESCRKIGSNESYSRGGRYVV
jgi:hypothetical protein